jgi:hypothetical protein
VNLRPAALMAPVAKAWQSMVTTFAPVRSTVVGYLHEPFAGAWQRGVQVEGLAPLTTFSAVFACVSRIANDIAKLQLQLMEQRSDGTWKPAGAEQPHWTPLRRPNSYQNRIQFITYWLICKLLHGNAYALKERDGRGMVRRLYLLDPRRVTPMVTAEGDVYYNVGGDDLIAAAAGRHRAGQRGHPRPARHAVASAGRRVAHHGLRLERDAGPEDPAEQRDVLREHEPPERHADRAWHHRS